VLKVYQWAYNLHALWNYPSKCKGCCLLEPKPNRIDTGYAVEDSNCQACL
jgi:hypothetical protein